MTPLSTQYHLSEWGNPTYKKKPTKSQSKHPLNENQIRKLAEKHFRIATFIAPAAVKTLQKIKSENVQEKEPLKHIRIVYESKDVFEGYIKKAHADSTLSNDPSPENFVRHGYGVARWRDGRFMEGIWVNNLFGGTGKIRRPLSKENGWYHGELKNDVAHGLGRFMCFNNAGTSYIGRCNAGYYDGLGLLFSSKNSWSMGRFVHGKPIGTLLFKTIAEGSVFIGNAKAENGVLIPGSLGVMKDIGQTFYEIAAYSKLGRPIKSTLEDGTLIYRSKVKTENHLKFYAKSHFYVGTLDSDIEHGHGTMVYDNGDYYVGFWNQGKPTGYGIQRHTYPNKTVYEGFTRYVEDKGIIRDGLGTLYDNCSAIIYAGLWENNEPWTEKNVLNPFSG